MYIVSMSMVVHTVIHEWADYGYDNIRIYLEVVVIEEESSEVGEFPELGAEVLDGTPYLQLCPVVPLLLLHHLLPSHHCPCNHNTLHSFENLA